MKNIFACVILFWAFSFAEECPVTPETQGPVSFYGKLKVRKGTPFIDGFKDDTRAQTLVQVRGVSFFWSRWSDFYNENAVERMAKDWKAELVRAAYSPTNVSLSENADNLNRVKTVIEAAIKNDVYVIIDWHSHNAHSETTNAKEFFVEMAETYGSCDNVIFELFNEPLEISWSTIKTYAESVISEIREYSDNLILVGTQTWSQKIQDVVGNAIDDENVGYVFHFYANSHRISNFRDNIDKVYANGLPTFVTEYGTTHADGGCSPSISTCSNGNQYNSHNESSSNDWHAYMDSKYISSAAWSVHDKYEGSAFFGTISGSSSGSFDQTVEANWTDTTKMTESGKYIFKKLNCYYLSAPWNPNPSQNPENSPYCYGTSSLGKVPLISGSFNFELIGSASLAVNLQQAGHVVVEVFSLQGKKVGELFNGHQNSGNFLLSIANLNLKNGVYIFKLRQNSMVQTKNLKIVK